MRGGSEKYKATTLSQLANKTGQQSKVEHISVLGITVYNPCTTCKYCSHELFPIPVT